jgi:hypothetical protein
MLSEDEIQALREIERRLRWHSPELVRLFESVEPQPESKHRQRARARVLLAAAAVTGVALLGPRMLNEAEVRTRRRRAPRPPTAPGPPIRFRARLCRRVPSRSWTYCSPRQPSSRRTPAMAHMRKREKVALWIGNPCTSSRSAERH